MPNLVKSRTFAKGALVASVALLVIVGGVGIVLKATVDNLLYWDATAAAESWARYVVENVADIEEIADGQQPSAESMAFFIRTQQIRYVFGFEIIDLRGDVQLASDGSKISSIRGAAHSDTAVLAAASGRPIIAVKEGSPPVRPKYYSEAYLPVIVDGRPQAVVAAYVDLSEQRAHFLDAFLLAALALCLLVGGAVGLPTIAWYRRTKEKQLADRRIRFLAHHDALTGLANRAQLMESLESALAVLPVRGGQPCRALHRSRPLQGGQRHARARRRRFPAQDRRRASACDRSASTTSWPGSAATNSSWSRRDVSGRDQVEEFARRLASAVSRANEVQGAGDRRHDQRRSRIGAGRRNRSGAGC